MRLDVGTTVGRYQIKALLGAGGMGVVYRARDTTLQRDVALKFLPPALALDPEALHRFVREARAASALNHPNILTVYDLDENAAGRFIVTELVEGDSLRDLVSESALNLEDALDVSAQIASALAAAHEAGIVHRDIKPENVIRRRDGRVKVLDFGIAKLARQGDPEDPDSTTDLGVTAPGIVVGTLRYMSPEQARGADVDGRSDVWSAGVVLYELLSGSPPFQGRGVADTLAAILCEQPAPIAGIPDDVARVIAIALAKNASDRYVTARDFECELRRAQNSLYLLASGTAALSSPARTASPVPELLTIPIGREQELAEICGLLRGTARLVTLTGPGGTGKTLLAMAVAKALQGDYPDGAVVVELGTVTDASQVMPAVARSLGVREAGTTPIGALVVDWVRDRHLLLAIDNFEQVLDAAQCLTALLAAGAGLRLLVTSREPLRLHAETEYPVATLGVPRSDADPDDVAAAPAVALFIERARAARPSLALSAENLAAIGEICVRVEGLPLAIELAAARVRHLSPQEIAARMDRPLALLTGGARDLPARHRTIRDTIAWSYELLDANEKCVFNQLSVFAGGFDLEAADLVAGLGENALEAVSSLVDKSLLERREEDRGSRYRMLETVREYGLERLAVSGQEAQTRQRFVDCYLAKSEDFEPKFWGGEDSYWLAVAERDMDNFRAAMSWALDDQPDKALGIAAALDRVWTLRGYYSEGDEWLRRATARCPEAPVAVRTRALLAEASLAFLRGDAATQRSTSEEALRLSRLVGDRRLECRSLISLGRGLHAEGRLYHEEALAIAAEIGDTRLLGTAYNNVGETARAAGDYATARGYYQNTIDLFRAIGGGAKMTVALLNLGSVHCQLGDYVEARDCYQESLALAVRFRASHFVCACLDGFAALAAATGAAERAGLLAGAADALRARAGIVGESIDRAFRDGFLELAREQLGRAAFEAAMEAGRRLSDGEAVRLACSPV
jgi:non-specific serine/threonine protein kinase